MRRPRGHDWPAEGADAPGCRGARESGGVLDGLFGHSRSDMHIVLLGV
jgi:hypothetical protein